jgi:hypothetical protein
MSAYQVKEYWFRVCGNDIALIKFDDDSCEIKCDADDPSLAYYGKLRRVSSGWDWEGGACHFEEIRSGLAGAIRGFLDSHGLPVKYGNES